MASNEEWNLPNSDDEAVVSTTTKDNDDMPIQILEYYEQLEQRQFLELKVEEFRKVILVLSDNTGNEDSCLVNKGRSSLEGEGDNDQSKDVVIVDDEEINEDKRSNELSEFDEFDEPEKCQGNIPKRTPKSGRLPKKRVGTLKNVISNLKRFRQMDNVSENNDTKHEGENEQINTSSSHDNPSNTGNKSIGKL